MPACPSTLVMPPGTPKAARATRLEVADWKRGLLGVVCPIPHDEWWQLGPAPVAAIAPRWVQLLFAMIVYTVMMAAMLAGMMLLSGCETGLPAVAAGLLLTAGWWGFIAWRWGRRP